MNSRKKELVLCVLSLVGAIAWFMIDFSERGFSLGILGGPVLIISIVGVPSLVSYLKHRKK